ncbi:uridine kinase family protein [Nakamurella lactea]|uniref:uridine kinase family protein n=1 Tax=Nakamurella lactea TaxID=459515 RepID=UPI00042995B0|nr:AAA family ATPase [Nakamurella lactea]
MSSPARSNPSLTEVANTILALDPRHPPTAVVAIDGPSGSGKTTLADRLGDAVAARHRSVALIHVDDLLAGWDGLADLPGDLLRWVLEPVAAGRRARYHRYDWTADRYAEWCEVPAAQVLIVEGVGSGALTAAPLLDLLLWVEAPEPIRFDRGIARDGEAYRPNWQRWALQEAAMFAGDRTRERADVRLDGTAPVP